MKQYSFLLILLFAGVLQAQLLSWNNPSFEGTAPGSSISPPSWSACGGSPDTQPGCWGATPAAAHGGSYIGLVFWLSSPTSQEGAGQLLPTPMVAGTPYSISLRLVNLDIYNGSWNGGAVVSIYGSTSACSFAQQQLWTSGNFVNSTWQTFNAMFTPTSNWTYFTLRVEPGVATTWPGVGIDNLLSSTVLPARMEHFDATLEDNAAQITWETTAEVNMESYTVQRATSNMDFQDLATVPAIGQDGRPHSYEYTDATLPEGLFYYRLKINDQDGSETLTEVREVLYSKSGQNIAIKTLFPNPADAISRLDLVTLIDQDVTVQVYDAAGRQIFTMVQACIEGENRIELPTDQWRPGMYRVQVRSGNTVLTKPLVVAR